MDKERQEAIEAGERALNSLYAAHKELSGARNWGIFDMLGGGLISTLVKRGKMENANGYIQQAKTDLQNFSRELRDVSQYLQIETGDFLDFADFFFDGFVADIMVQQRINNAGKQVEDAICHVEDILEELRGQIAP